MLSSQKNILQGKSTNICTRCGMDRVISKTYKEWIQTYSGKSLLTHTDTICPNKECQKVVESDLAAARARTAETKRIKEEKALERSNLKKVELTLSKAKKIR